MIRHLYRLHPGALLRIVVITSLLHCAAAVAQDGPQGEGAAAAQQTLILPASDGRIDAGEGSITFIGNATVLIRYGGITILTDPNFLHKGEHVHLGYGLKSQRLTEPAIPLEKLPPVDLIVLSHFHGDHFDQLVQQKLDRRIPIVTTEDASEKLAALGFQTRRALRTWQSLLVKKGDASVRISAAPGRHGPPVLAALLPQVMGSVLDFAIGGNRAYRMYISGDTMVYRDIDEIPRRFPDIDLALLHLGGTRILGVMTVTMDARQGMAMLRKIDPRHAIPIHYNDYDVFKSPLADFEREVNAAGWKDRITYLKHGEVYRFRPRR